MGQFSLQPTVPTYQRCNRYYCGNFNVFIYTFKVPSKEESDPDIEKKYFDHRSKDFSSSSKNNKDNSDKKMPRTAGSILKMTGFSPKNRSKQSSVLISNHFESNGGKESIESESNVLYEMSEQNKRESMRLYNLY